MNVEDIKDEVIITDPDWNEVIRFLHFQRSYLEGTSFPCQPEDLVKFYVMGQADIPSFTCGNQNRIEEAVNITTPNRQDFSQWTKNEPRKRLMDIYLTYTRMPSIIEKEITQQTELGDLLTVNPEIKDLLLYLSTGKSIPYYIRQTGLESILASKKLSLAIERILSDNKATHGKGCPIFRSHVKKFLEISVMSHYFQREDCDYGPFSRIMKPKNPYSINYLKYFENYFEQDSKPQGIVLESIQNFLTAGSIFLENVLLFLPGTNLSIYDLTQDRKKQCRRILNLMHERLKV